jgi:hypothetical protein
MKAYNPTTGEHERGFWILIDAPQHRRVHLPAAGCPNYTGDQALAVMRRYADDRPKVKTLAYTEANGIEETLTIQELAELYDDTPELVTVTADEAEAGRRERRQLILEAQSRRLVATELDTTGDLFDRMATANPLLAVETPAPKVEPNVRSHHGFFQFRDGAKGRWLFYLSSFSGDGKTAHIRTDHDTLEDIPITPAGYITIAGRKYGPRQWDH